MLSNKNVVPKHDDMFIGDDHWLYKPIYIGGILCGISPIGVYKTVKTKHIQPASPQKG